MGFSLGLGLDAAFGGAVDAGAAAAVDVGAGVGADALAAGGADLAGSSLALDAGIADIGAAGAGASSLAADAGIGAAGAADAGLAAEGGTVAADLGTAAGLGDIGGGVGGADAGAAGLAAPSGGLASSVPGATGAGGFGGASAASAAGQPIGATQLLDQTAGGGDLLNISGGSSLGSDASVPESSTFASQTIDQPPTTIDQPPAPSPTAGQGDAATPGADYSTGGTATPPPASALTPAAPAPAVAPPATTTTPAPTAAPPAPAAATAAPAAAAKSGFGGWGTAAMLGLGAAPLAATLIKGEASLPPQAATLTANNANITAAANSYLAGVQSNTPTPPQAAQLATMQQSLTNQWRQALMNQGVQNPAADTRWPQIQAQIDQQVTASAQSMIQTNLQAALGLSGQASTNLIALANMQIQQDTAFQNSITEATKALGTVAALGAVSGKLG